MQTRISFNTHCNEEQSLLITQDKIATATLLPAKVDTLINEFKEFKIKSLGNQKDSRPNPLLAVDAKSAEETAELLLQWSDVKNILDLVRVCKHIQFFSGDEEQGILSVIHCETCFEYIRKYKVRGSMMNVTAMDAAKKGLGG